MIMQYCEPHERKAARRLVRAILAPGEMDSMGGFVSVNDGEEWVVKRSQNEAEIMAALGSTDTDRIRAYLPDRTPAGSFLLVYGNEPGVLIADYTDNDYCNEIAKQVEDD